MPHYTILSLTIAEDKFDENEEIPSHIKEAYLDASFGKDVDGAISHGLYKPTCVVEAADPEDLFVKTQHIDESWDQVNPPSWSDGPLRSTSVGDAIINHDNDEVLTCGRLGWSSLEGDIADSLRALRVNISNPAPGA
jgi:hypothetical protein